MTRKAFLKFVMIALGGVGMSLSAEQRSQRAPAFFVGHGSPMNALEDNPFTDSLRDLGKRVPRPKAILVISAHWTPPYLAINLHDKDELLYDMFGFPDALYALEYPAVNATALHSEIQRLLGPVQVKRRGLDHGVWSVLMHMFPQADIPVLQLAINTTLSMQEHFELGRRIRSLRKQGVMIIGSGNITHNLRDINQDKEAEVAAWAKAFDGYVKEAIEDRNFDALIHFQQRQQYARHAHPTSEHYIPLLYIAGASYPDDRSRFVYEQFEHATLSMRSWLLS